MLKFILKRFLIMIPVILGISFIIFSIMELTPGDPARLILGESASKEDVEALREELGLNDNFFIRYVKYVKGAIKGDFGKSYRTKIPVGEELFSRYPTTLKLAFGSTILMVLLGVPIGILSAVKQYSLVDKLSLISALLLTSMPAFWLGLMLILLFSIKFKLLPATGVDTYKNYILPCATLAASLMASLIRITRSNLLEVIRQDYIRTAKAKGAGPRRIIFKHALRNALLPIITIIGLNFGYLIGGAIIIESVFAIPGVGTLTIMAVRMKDTPVVMAAILFVAVSLGIINLLIDVLYAYVDPRLKSQYLKG